MATLLETETGHRAGAVEQDADIVARVRGGDRDAYRLLVERYQDVLYRHALSLLGDADAAADVTQATLVAAYAKLGELREAGSFGGWVYRMCGNRCRDQLKSVRRRDIPLDAAPDALLRSADAADGPMEQRALRAALQAALLELNEEHRAAFLLKHVEERSYDEMSELLGASVSALKMRVHRAREALRSALEGVL